MDVDTAIQWIHNRKKFSKTPGLTRVQHLLHLLGNPEQNIRAVHIAGTNGKGSTVAYLTQLFQAAGYRVGSFTSPYIEAFNERICINGDPIPDMELVHLIKKIQPLVAEMDQDPELEGITEFEITTAMMLYYFANQSLDIVLLEVGLGGMYDPTNVIVNPLVTAISTIGYDHMDILGETIEAITQQKIGIFKPEVPVVLGNLSEKAKKTCEDYAQTLHCSVYKYGEDYTVNYLGRSSKKVGERFTYKDQNHCYKRLLTPLIGVHQVDNAALALQIFDIVASRDKLHVSTNEIQRAFNNVYWPGRMEIVQDEPFIIVDGAHNTPAIRALVDSLREEYPDYHVHFLFAAIHGKDYRHMVEMLETLPNSDITLTTFELPKALSCDYYNDMQGKENITIEMNWRQAFFHLLQRIESEEEMIVVTGSLYFISEVRKFLFNGNNN